MAIPHPTFVTPKTSVSSAAPVTEAVPAPKRRWFRKKRFLLPVLALMVALTIGGVYAWKIEQAFQTVNAISTPPPVVSGESLGGESSVSIDTGPAQAAVQTYEAQQNEIALAPSPTPEPTESAPTEIPATEEMTLGFGAAAESTDEPRIIANTDRAPEQEPTVTVEPSDVPADEESTLVADATDAPTEERSTVVTEPTDAPVDVEPTATTGSQSSVDDAQPSPTAEIAPTDEASSEAITILLMGVDAREGEAIDVGVRPDSLAVLRLDPETKSCRMLQIPRDSRVELPGYGLTKINHALAVGGIPYEIQVVEQYLGVTIDHYGLVDFGAVVTVIDDVGGVTVDNPAAFEAEGVSFPVGVQTLSGAEALTYSRFRSDAQGDFGRMSRQQEVLRAILSRVSPSDVPGMLPSTLPMLEDHFRTDMDATALAGLAQDYSWCTADALETNSLDGTVATYPDPLLDMDLSYVIIDESERVRGRDWLLGS